MRGRHRMPAPRIHIIGLESAPRPEATHRWLAVRRARRTTARSFVNDIAPDPLADAGQKREPILVSVGQSICWVISRSWSELPELTENTACGPDFPGIGSRLKLDDFVIITHSLGSRATLDALQRLTNLSIAADPRLKLLAEDFRRSAAHRPGGGAMTPPNGAN
jgi:hypothetical protein